MTSYEILVKCGYSPEEASRISGLKIPKTTQGEIARMNEERFGGQLTYEDRFLDKRARPVMRVIEENKPDIGDCTTRKGVYRRMHFGAGNLSRKGWLKRGFAENLKGEVDK